jgi:hypothetical protein
MSHIYLLHKAGQRSTNQKDYIKRKVKLLLEVHFGFIPPLALGAFEDLHVKLRRTAMVIEEHEKP